MRDYTRLNEALHRHAGLYGLLLPQIASALFFGGKPCGHVLKRFATADEPTMEINSKATGSAFPGGRTWARLTPAGSAAFGFPKDRGSNLSEYAMHGRLAVLWHCCANLRHRRHRVESDQAAKLLGVNVPDNVVHIIGRDKGGHYLERVYVTTTDTLSTVEKVQTLYTEMVSDSKLRPWIETGQLGICVLAEEPAKCASIKEALGMKAGGPPLTQLCRITVGLGPSPRSIDAALKRWERKGGDDA